MQAAKSKLSVRSISTRDCWVNMKTRRFFDEVYGVEFVLVSDCTPAQFAKFIHTHYDARYEQDDDLKGQCLARTDNQGLYTSIIYVRRWQRNSPFCVATLAHEVFHAVEDCMDYHGLPHCSGSSEAWSYYLDFVLRRCLELLK